MSKQRARKRQALLDATAEKLKEVRSTVEGGKLRGKDKIAMRLENLAKKYKVDRQFVFTVRDDRFDVQIDDKQKAAEAALDGAFKELQNVGSSLTRGKLHGKSKIRQRVNKIVTTYKVAKHFVLNIEHDGYDFHIDEKKVAAEAALDGIYVVRTSLSNERFSSEDTVRSYKSLSQVERAFRSIKTVDLKVRPIRHHLEKRVQAHIFLCVLAYYVEWHMREAWRPLLFTDEEKERKKTSDPVAPANRSDAALQKVRSKRLDDGTEVHSFQTLLKLMSQIVRNECHLSGAGPGEPSFEIVTTPNEKQKRAYHLLDSITL